MPTSSMPEARQVRNSCNSMARPATHARGQMHVGKRMQAEEAAQMEAWRSAESARLARDRRVLEKQSRALLKVCGHAT